MAVPSPQRRSGVLADWSDERGFGFIMPSDGGRRVFAHISEFAKDAPRPASGDELSFVVGAGGDGRQQAVSIETIHSARAALQEIERRRPVERHRGRISWLPIYVVPVFTILFVLIAVYWRMPLWAVLLYPCMSAATFALYLLDKRAALGGGWRTREATLQVAALLGGWPGAIFAQQILRHKNRKPSFQAAFWCIVVLKIAILLVIVWYEGPMAVFFEQLGNWFSGAQASSAQAAEVSTI